MSLLNALSASVVVSIMIACSGVLLDQSAAVPPGTRHPLRRRRPRRPRRRKRRPLRPAPAVNPTGSAVKAFLDRMNEYVKFHNNVEKMVLP